MFGQKIPRRSDVWSGNFRSLKFLSLKCQSGISSRGIASRRIVQPGNAFTIMAVTNFIHGSYFIINVISTEY